MNVLIKNLGYIDSGKITIGDLTIICGRNNSGKTYLNYALYGFLKNWNQYLSFNLEANQIEELISKGFIKIDLTSYEKQIPKTLENACKKYSKSIYKIFSTEEDSFADFEFMVTPDNYTPDYSDAYSSGVRTQENEILTIKKEKDSCFLEVTSVLKNEDINQLPDFILKDSLNSSIADIFFSKLLARPFIITSERSGISLFFKELDINKNIIMEKLQGKKNIEKIDFIKMIDESLSRYAKSIRENIDIIRDYDNLTRRKSFIFQDKTNLKPFVNYLEIILGGSFKIINEYIYFLPKSSEKKKSTPIPLYATSSAVKSLLLLDLYIKHLAKPNDFLMIDEPELNLHPANQRLIARLIVRLVKKGIRVFLTTHSEIIIKEINNLIMLNSIPVGKRNKLFKKYKYEENELIDKKQVKVFVTNENTIKPVNIENFGIQIDTLEEIITNQIECSEDIYFTLLENTEENETI